MECCIQLQFQYFVSLFLVKKRFECSWVFSLDVSTDWVLIFSTGVRIFRLQRGVRPVARLRSQPRSHSDVRNLQERSADLSRGLHDPAGRGVVLHDEWSLMVQSRLSRSRAVTTDSAMWRSGDICMLHVSSVSFQQPFLMRQMYVLDTNSWFSNVTYGAKSRTVRSLWLFLIVIYPLFNHLVN